LAHTSLSDIIHPNIFSAAVTEAVTAKSALLSSGAIVTSNEMAALAGQAGHTGTLPLFGLQDYSDPDLAKDDGTNAGVNGIKMGPQSYQKDYFSKTFGEAELASTLSGEDILGHIVNNVVAPYWVQAYQRFALAKLSGVIKDNIANDAGDMVRNVATDAVGAAAASELANVGTVTEAMASMGDAFGKLQLIVMHSRVFFNLLKNEPTNTDPASATQPFATYMGLPVIIDDGMPAVVGTNRTTYTTYLLGRGALAFGEANLGARSVAVVTDERAGNGWGLSTVTSRKQLILHPVGFSSAATVSANTGSPAASAYDAASAWDRKVSRKNAAIVAFRTNG
jgi:hypothetical protein